jgi:hypothetical protein
VALLSASRSAKPIGLSFGSVAHWPAAAVIAGIAFAAVHAGRRHPGRLRAMLTGTGAGLVFGIQDALTRQTLEILSANGVGAMFTTWAPYALVGAGATGIWLMQSAFNAGPLPLSLPAISAGEPVVGILLGVLVFGDRIQITPGELALQAGGIVALIVGVILVGRAPALSQLRRLTPPGLPHITGGLPALPGIHGRAARAPAEHAGQAAGPDEHRAGGDGYRAGGDEGQAGGDEHRAGSDRHRAGGGRDEQPGGGPPGGAAHPGSGTHPGSTVGNGTVSLNGHVPVSPARTPDSEPADPSL